MSIAAYNITSGASLQLRRWAANLTRPLEAPLMTSSLIASTRWPALQIGEENEKPVPHAPVGQVDDLSVVDSRRSSPIETAANHAGGLRFRCCDRPTRGGGRAGGPGRGAGLLAG